ncbi:MAG TPA: DHH family phosphoesterase [Candidatus Merdenecus merdavium]|nr:DHH family phosphoesterase [Candidatus Merdenecus merdavium]
MKNKIKMSGQLMIYIKWPIFLTMLLVIMNVCIYFVSVKAGLIMTMFVGVYLLITLILYFYNRPLIMNELISFATQYGQIQKTLLKQFEIPYGLLDTDGKIMWMNKEFQHVTGKDKNYRKSITSIFERVTKEKLPVKETQSNIHVSYNERDYRISLQKVSLDNIAESVNILDIPPEREYLIAVYLFDETELRNYERENIGQKLVTGLIYIDNYDEALESIEEVRRSLLMALIDRKINKYISNADGIVKKLEKDKYFIIFKQKYLNTFKENKFSLLEDVKTVNIGNEMSVTLSIGIGLGHGSYQQNYEYSRAAIDLALGRGGDQAVIKDNEKITYYGGKSQHMEKNTRVKARVKAHALRELLETKEKVIVMGHQIQDVDAFGAAVGIHCAARALDKKAHILINEVTTSVASLMDYFVDNPDYEKNMFIKNPEAMDIVDEKTAVIVVDTNRPSLTECEELLSMTNTIVVLDHHRRGSEVIENAVLSYIEPYASSTCEMVAEVLQYFSDNIRIRSVEADCIYAGIIVDTNNFMTKAGVRTFEAAAFLRRSGADITRVRKLFRNDMVDYKARAEAIKNAEIYKNAYAITICPSEGIKNPTVVGAQASNELLNILGVKASFVITEYNGKMYISARSIDEVNVQIIMERMGGGGHMNIAGAQLEGKDVEETKKFIKHILDKMLEDGDI